MRGVKLPLIARRVEYTRKPSGDFYSYPYYRQKYYSEIAEDCIWRCVYCGLHEDDLGGRDCMELDHFRPYRDARFGSLRDDPANFHHACARCNRLKSDHWPGDLVSTHDGVCGFIDPFVEDRSLYFKVSDDGELVPLRAPAEYMVRLLHLNRPFLRNVRVMSTLMRAAASMAAEYLEGRRSDDGAKLARMVLLMAKLGGVDLDSLKVGANHQ